MKVVRKDRHLTWAPMSGVKVFSTAYFPPVSWVVAAMKEQEILIEAHEHFIKQTYRNRCIIAGPNGEQSLIVPLKHKGSLTKTAVKDVLIDNSVPWQRTHWRSVRAAYNNAPYFEYLEDELAQIFEQRWENLLELNQATMKFLFSVIKVNPQLKFTESFSPYSESKADMRLKFHPKQREKITPYHQVFADRHGFIQDVSALDRVVNERFGK